MKLMREVYRCDEEDCDVTVIHEKQLTRCGGCNRDVCGKHLAQDFVLVSRERADRAIATFPRMCKACAWNVAILKPKIIGDTMAKLISDPENLREFPHEEKA